MTKEQLPDPTVVALHQQLAVRDMEGVRRALAVLTPEGRRELEARLGAPAVERMLRSARRARGPKRGRVVVIHGIMGGKLEVTRKRDTDLVWVSYPRLILGRIGDFELDGSGNQADPQISVRVGGLLDEYLPLIMELDSQWQVLPFAFDWRLDIEQSAHQLNDAIVAFAAGEPVHIVAHSMGGLVSRCFAQLHPSTWNAIADPAGLKRGGRLVMLGTPNRGSFAIPFVLTGEEKTVRMLEMFDLKHHMDELLGIIDTFVGSYQMLPSPRHVFGSDDRQRLYEQGTWGVFPVVQANLDRGRRFQDSLDAVVDAPRLLYVAGYDQATPYRIRVDGPGQFSYLETNDGDGRVPHELGLLPGVATFYVREKHGDLPANNHVLAAIHELLSDGMTAALEGRLPAGRARARSLQWRKATEIAPVPPEVNALIGTRGTARRIAMLDRSAQRIVESAIVDSFVGAKRSGPGQSASARADDSKQKPAKAPHRPAVTVELQWGDICRADGEVYAAGHYQGVLPQAGELALDHVVSGIRHGEPAAGRGLVITSLSRRGVLSGAVGDVNFFPWANGRGHKTVAIAGMGHPGTFGKSELKHLARSLTEAVMALPGVRTVNLLLIGSGNGNLEVPIALDGLLRGMIEALRDGVDKAAVRRIRIVERDWKQAQVISRSLRALKASGEEAHAGIEIHPEVVAGDGGSFGFDIALSAVLVTLANPGKGGGSRRQQALKALLQGIPADHGLRKSCEDALREIGTKGKGGVLDVAEKLNFGRTRATGATGSNGDPDVPARMSFIASATGVRAAAITDTAVVPERAVSFDWKLVDELIERMTDPQDLGAIPDLSALLTGFVIPPDFRERVSHADTVIFEVDRETARINWEMLGILGNDFTGVRSVGLESRVARQLRTSYSPPPSRVAPSSDKLRALVIGDPGDPDKGFSLPGARREAIEVARFLTERGIQVDALIGAPNARPDGELREFEPATTLDVLRLMRNRSYDIMHYAGHGDFDPDDPEHRAGWIFGDRFFTSRELGCIDTVPSLVVANACLSAQTSRKRGGKGFGDDRLLPGLVDEFFRRGVRNYVGTAWEVNDDGAVLFTKTLYAALVPDGSGAASESLGRAMHAARNVLKDQEALFGALWAAYQHYGDPTFRFSEANAVSAGTAGVHAAGGWRRAAKAMKRE